MPSLRGARPVRGVITAALLLCALLPARAQTDGADLRRAMDCFPALILGPTVRQADGTGPFAHPCPAPGGRVEQRGGPTTFYDGADPADPALCRMRFGGVPAEAWFGIWLTAWPGAQQARTALDHLIHGRTGDIEGFVVRMTPERTYYDILRNEGLEDLRVAGRVFRTVKISHYREAAPPNVYRSVVTGWKDITSGMLVYVTYQHISGAPETGTPLDPTLIVSPP